MVLKQSSPNKKFETFVVPSAIAPNMTARCEIDLSPGIAIVPFNPFSRLIFAILCPPICVLTYICIIYLYCTAFFLCRANT